MKPGEHGRISAQLTMRAEINRYPKSFALFYKIPYAQLLPCGQCGAMLGSPCAVRCSHRRCDNAQVILQHWRRTLTDKGPMITELQMRSDLRVLIAKALHRQYAIIYSARKHRTAVALLLPCPVKDCNAASFEPCAVTRPDDPHARRMDAASLYFVALGEVAQDPLSWEKSAITR